MNRAYALSDGDSFYCSCEHFQKSYDGPIDVLGDLIECVSEAEAVTRAEQMTAYPEYLEAVAFALRRRDGLQYDSVVIKASFGVFTSTWPIS